MLERYSSITKQERAPRHISGTTIYRQLSTDALRYN